MKTAKAFFLGILLFCLLALNSFIPSGQDLTPRDVYSMIALLDAVVIGLLMLADEFTGDE
ncbi:MAG: hypothetical protein Q8910_04310 [Bacteroidota bacterium]|nr:hypothetical protein [Bacteroidota bacterium]